MRSNWTVAHRGWIRVAAAVVALAVCAVFTPWRDSVSVSEVSLLLVLVVVAAAATGDWWAGVIAALAGAVGVDFFLMPPYMDLHIATRANIELAVVLLIVGLAVSQLSVWGARQKAVAGERQGYLDGALAIADLNAEGAPRDRMADAVAAQMQRILGAERVTYEASAPETPSAVLERDGTLRVGGRVVDAQTEGLPTDRFTAVPVTQANGKPGHFRITAAAYVLKVRSEQLRVLVLLADEFSASERERVS